MALAREHQLFQAALEIQYDRGFQYFDKCGSLMLRLQDAFGVPRFDGGLPTVQVGELRNDSERLICQYGPGRMVMTQSWMPSPVRFEQLAPIAWETVSAAIGVGQQVMRFGVRFWLLWKVDTLAEARQCVERSGFGRWGTLFGQRQVESASAQVRDDSAEMRVTLDAVKTAVEPGMLPVSLASIVPTYAVQLDLDHIHTSSVDPRMPKDQRTAFSLNRDQVRDFIRKSWVVSLNFAAKARPLFGPQNDD